MLDILPRLAAEGIVADAIVTDPPYGLEFMGKKWDAPLKLWETGAGFGKPGIGDRNTPWPAFGAFGAANPTCANCGGRARGAKRCGCAEPKWKSIGKRRGGAPIPAGDAPSPMQAYQQFSENWARQAFAVLRPGGFMLVFGGTRTYHRMACAIEDAGFEIRDAIMWHYGTGFPKSLNVSKAIDKAAGAERKVVATVRYKGGGTEHINRSNAAVHDYRPDGYQKGENILDVTTAATPEAAAWEGWGTALKPATEIICVARKPLSERTVAANVLKHGTGALNIDECRIGYEDDKPDPATNPLYRAQNGYANTSAPDTNSSSYTFRADGGPDRKPQPAGRWPANLAHDGSPEVMALFPDSAGQQAAVRPDSGTGQKTNGILGKFATNSDHEPRGDTGSAARFFYSTKAGAEDRWGSKHPTVKPVKLIEWLITLVTRKGGLVLDCFAGSGTAGVAALATGRNAILVEQDESYVADIRERMAFYQGDGRHSLASKNRNVGARDKPGPLL